MACRTLLSVAAFSLLLAPAWSARAQSPTDEPSADAKPATGAAAAPDGSAAADKAPDIPLPEVPKLAPIRFDMPDKEAAEELASRLDQLCNLDDVSGPLDDSIEWDFLLQEVNPQLVLAAAQRLDELKEQLEGGDAVKLLKKARSRGRKALRKAARKDKSKKNDDGDWLTFMLALDDDDRGQTWRDVVELYGMLRMLEAAKAPNAVRVMVGSYSSFGELVRIDLQRSLARLKDVAVPALMEAKKHDARKVRIWSNRQLDALGKAIPGEAVSTTDPVVLAAVLRAFGRIRDNDATRVILSFANSDRSELRQAAREAVGAMGEPATWHLKDTYKNLTDKKPPRSWDHVRTARELFRLYDRARLAEVYSALDAGQRASKEKRYAEAIKHFDAVLARAPMMAGRETMASAYEARADQLFEEKNLEAAVVMARKALRLTGPDADTTHLRARIYYMEGKQLVDAGTPDPFILKRAIELDPDFVPAKELLASLDVKSQKRQSVNKRYVAAGVIGVLGLAGMVVIARRRPREEDVEPRKPNAAPPLSAAQDPAQQDSAAAPEQAAMPPQAMPPQAMPPQLGTPQSSEQPPLAPPTELSQPSAPVAMASSPIAPESAAPQPIAKAPFFYEEVKPRDEDAS